VPEKSYFILNERKKNEGKEGGREGRRKGGRKEGRKEGNLPLTIIEIT
jgi:hypothetical protein